MITTIQKENDISANTMKAIRFHEFGGPEVLRYEDVPRPELKAGEVLVRVHAIGINPPDWYVREGMKILPPEMRPTIPLPYIPGTDISGVVEAVASDVKDFSIGDDVFGMVRFPRYGSNAYAEYVAAPASDLALKPAGIDHAHAAAASMSGLTAWQYLIDIGHNEPNPLQPAPHRPVPLSGKTVLINGAGISPYSWQNGRGLMSLRWHQVRMRRSFANLVQTNSSTTPRTFLRMSCMTLISLSTPLMVQQPVVSCAHSSRAALCFRFSLVLLTLMRLQSLV